LATFRGREPLYSFKILAPALPLYAPVATKVLSSALPRLTLSRRLSNAELAWLAFIAVQLLDGVMSYIGVQRIGSHIEANPLLGWYLEVFGPAVAFTGAKLFAIACGAILYFTDRHRWVAALTVVYVVFAVGPWIHILGTLS
jgi:hypothetical protein